MSGRKECNIALRPFLINFFLKKYVERANKSEKEWNNCKSTHLYTIRQTETAKGRQQKTFGDGKEHVNRQKLNAPDKTKYDIYHAVKGALKTARNWNEFQQNLRKQDIEIEFKYKGQTSEVQGIRFVKDGLSYKGSQVDRSFSSSKLDAQLSKANHQEQPKQVFTPQLQQPKSYEQTSSKSSIGGLFDIPFIPNGTDPEEKEFRKRMQQKKKKGKKL